MGEKIMKEKMIQENSKEGSNIINIIEQEQMSIPVMTEKYK